VRTPSPPKMRRRVAQSPRTRDQVKETPPRLGSRNAVKLPSKSSPVCQASPALTPPINKPERLAIPSDEASELCEETMKAWVAGNGPMEVEAMLEMEPQPWLRSVFGTAPYKAVAKAGDYHVSVPELSDVPRLRALERELVYDHCKILRHERSNAQSNPQDWCSLISVIYKEEAAWRSHI